MKENILDGEIAIVTGGGSGIGRAIAEQFAAEGATVIVTDIDTEGGTETVDEVEDAGGDAVFVETDISKNRDVRKLFDFVADRFEGLDTLVNNAGGSLPGDGNLHRIDEETWKESIDVNLSGAFLCSREALPLMMENGGGQLIHISSVNGLTGIGLTAYSAAKSGLFALSRTIATQYGRHGIRSNVICPGTIETERRRKEMAKSDTQLPREEWLDQYPLGRFGRPDDVANAALYLGSKLSEFVTGSELVVDGGLTCGLNHRFEQTVYNVDERPARR